MIAHLQDKEIKMKKIIDITLIISLVTLFTGCGDKTSTSDSASPYVPVIVQMEKDVPVNIKAKDSIINTSEDAEIEILVVDETKTATLINDGNASILRGR